MPMQVERPELVGRVPAAVAAVVRDLATAGEHAWLVGGTVRDLLRGETPRDYDVATTRRPEAIQAALPTADLGDARFGAARVATAAGSVAITTLREDGAYGDRRHPDAVAFVRDPAVDARRRDFTINALYLDLATGTVLDPAGGLPDLEQGVLRTVGDPVRRFTEDPLRVLRAVRFAARCRLAIAPATRAAAVAAAGDLASLAPERAFAELTDAFTGGGRGEALRLLVELGCARVLLPEVAAMDGVPQPPEYHPEGDVLTHVCLVLEQVPPGDHTLAWSAVLHDVGKPPTYRVAEDRIRFDGHDVLSERMAVAVLQRFRASSHLVAAVAEICREHIRFAALPRMRPRRREAFLRGPRFPQHLAFHRADCLGSHRNLEIHAFAAAEHARLPPQPPPLVTGKDVLALGVAPGPRVGRLLAAVHATADEAPMPMDREQALAFLRELILRERQDGGPGAR